MTMRYWCSANLGSAAQDGFRSAYRDIQYLRRLLRLWLQRYVKELSVEKPGPSCELHPLSLLAGPTVVLCAAFRFVAVPSNLRLKVHAVLCPLSLYHPRIQSCRQIPFPQSFGMLRGLLFHCCCCSMVRRMTRRPAQLVGRRCWNLYVGRASSLHCLWFLSFEGEGTINLMINDFTRS